RNTVANSPRCAGARAARRLNWAGCWPSSATGWLATPTGWRMPNFAVSLRGYAHELTGRRWYSGPLDFLGRLQIDRQRIAVLPGTGALDVGDDEPGELLRRLCFNRDLAGGQVRHRQRFVA